MDLEEAKDKLKKWAEKNVFQKYTRKSFDQIDVIREESLRDAVKCFNEHDEEYLIMKRKIEDDLKARENLEKEASELEQRLKVIYEELKKRPRYSMLDPYRVGNTLKSFMNELNGEHKRKKLKM